MLLAAGLLIGLIWLLVAAPASTAHSLDAAALYALTPAGFERYVADVFVSSGYVVRVVGGSGDGGVDVRVWRNGVTGVVQCKRYRPDRALGPAAVRELVGTRTHVRARAAWLATTAPLSPAAARLAVEEGIVILDARTLVACSHRRGRL
jgi:restriction system protein